MPMKTLRLAALLLVVSACTAGTRPETPPPSKPNIIFILADDLRNDSLGCAGHPILKTPHIDRLAARGTRFTNAFVTTSICAASRATIFTGCWERTHRYTFGTPPIPPELCDMSYPTTLRAAGYRTGFTGKFGVGLAREKRDAMFDVFHPLNRGPYFRKQKDGSVRHTDELAGDRAVDFLRSQPKDKPFCLSISFNSVHAEDRDKKDHYPWPPSADGLYEKIDIPPPRLSDPAIFESQPDVLKNSINRERWFWRWDTDEKYQKNIRAYYRMITGMDAIIGRVLAEVDTLGFGDNTVVIFMGDNGYYMGQRGFAGKWTHYEESLRVPLIIYDPRVPANLRGRTTDLVALNTDIAPTIVGYAGIRIPKTHQGTSLGPLVQGAQVKTWRTDFFCEHLMNHKTIPKWEGVRDVRWVYARYFEQKPPVEFLHDLKKDPDQLKNFASSADHADVLDRMRRRCDTLRDSYGGAWSAEKFLRKPKKKK